MHFRNDSLRGAPVGDFFIEECRNLHDAKARVERLCLCNQCVKPILPLNVFRKVARFCHIDSIVLDCHDLAADKKRFRNESGVEAMSEFPLPLHNEESGSASCLGFLHERQQFLDFSILCRCYRLYSHRIQLIRFFRPWIVDDSGH